MDIFEQLSRVLVARRNADPESSYVASLYQQGLDKILEKVGEETTEVLLAAKNLQRENNEKQQQALIGEVADLWFHTMVMLTELDVPPAEILARLDDRFGLSGLTEKAGRTS